MYMYVDDDDVEKYDEHGRDDYYDEHGRDDYHDEWKV